MDTVQMFCGSIESSVTNTQGKGKNQLNIKVADGFNGHGAVTFMEWNLT